MINQNSGQANEITDIDSNPFDGLSTETIPSEESWEIAREVKIDSWIKSFVEAEIFEDEKELKLSKSPLFSMTPAPKTLVYVTEGGGDATMLKNSLAAIAPKNSGLISPNMSMNSDIEPTVVGKNAGPFSDTPMIPPGTLKEVDAVLCDKSISLSKKPGDLNVCSAIITPSILI